MQTEKIKVSVTDTGNVLEVVVLNKQASRIEVVLGEGVHSVRCELIPNRGELAYAICHALGLRPLIGQARVA